MKRLLIFFTSLFISSNLFAQYPKEAETLVREGIAYHDKGNYAAAIEKYDQALLRDENNVIALSEKAYSLNSMGKYKEAIECCKLAIENNPDDESLNMIYVNYGNSTDALKKPEEALEIYNMGIEKFPEFNMLYFNKGVTLSSLERYDEAMKSFQTSVKLNPKHASSHNAIGVISNFKKQRIPTVLALGAFLAIEPEGKRALNNSMMIQDILGANVKKTGKKTIQISIDPGSLSDTTEDGKKNENNFTSVDLIVSMFSALDFDKKKKKKSDVELFHDKFRMMCSTFTGELKDNHGFFWEYYTPYFGEMYNQNLTETFSYIVFASRGDKTVDKWIKTNKNEVVRFYEWTNQYEWVK
jgi:tetratricopeptide (TPR) repeat protein